MKGGPREFARMTSAAYHQKEDRAANQGPVEQLLDLLDADPELARRKYERIRTKLTNLFRWRGCPEPAEYAARTIEGAARELIDGDRSQIQNPYLYFHRVASNVANALKGIWAQTQNNSTRQAAGSNATIGFPAALAGPAASGAQLSERALECLRDCLAALPPESLDLITRYHQPDKADVKGARKELARSLGITPAALRTRAFNIRANLVRSVTNCLERSESLSPDDTGHFGTSWRGSVKINDD